ncbi:hypothetical protein RRG08_050473 [Elysia crispata]|uniref:EGF-like domain-containing protein n=1 Tax=Elysia crispata TaxID=231223 RepID=A0AAE1CVS3_9GAST|nr:hypothetical protein RRG08_050473 [Elysia crispata]
MKLILALALVCSVSMVTMAEEAFDCTITPCMNGASCLTAGDEFYCACPLYYIGDRCETKDSWILDDIQG